MPNTPNDQPGDDSDEKRPSSDIAEETAGEDTEPSSPDSSSSTDVDASASAPSIEIGDAKERARDSAEELLDHEFEGVIKVEAGGNDGWRTVVEVVERNAVPDTQDIIGRYEILLDAAGSVTGYELLERYRRGDMKEEL